MNNRVNTRRALIFISRSSSVFCFYDFVSYSRLTRTSLFTAVPWIQQIRLLKWPNYMFVYVSLTN